MSDSDNKTYDELIDLINKLQDQISVLEDRINELENSADLISDEVIGIVSALNKTPGFEKISGIDSADIDALIKSVGEDAGSYDVDEDAHSDDCDCDDCNGDEDEEESKFIRCPFCNTLIFLTDENAKEIRCPFCDEKFTKEDLV